ncbi:MAG: helicase-associated domain-containing protein, partial [Terrabacter sp.]
MASTSRSLADDVRGRSDAQLIDLVLARPDLARPAPADLTSLAARAGTRASVQRAVEALDRGHLQVLEALVVAGDAADGGDLLRLLGTEDATTVETLVEDLWRSALVWRGADGHHVVRTVPEVLGTSVAGLGAPMRELRPSAPAEHSSPEHVAAVIAEAPDDARAMLERMTWGPAFGVLPTATPGRTTARWLLEHHLLVPVSADRVALPREVGLVLRDGRLHRAAELTPPAVEARSVSLVDAAAGGAASECLTHLDELAAAWGAEPPRVLRAGGLSVRDLRLAQAALDLDPEHTAFVVELAYAAGLVADDGEVVPVWAPTSEIDDWSSSEAGHRWATLALAWLASTRAPHLVGRRSTGTGPANALGPDVQWPAIRGIRREVLRELASLEPGSAPAPTSLRERLAWRRPNRSAGVLDEAVDAVLREAEWLGVTGRGALSQAGRALVPPPGRPADATRAAYAGEAGSEPTLLDRAAAAMSAHLPSPVDHILVQADLTAVAPGPLVGGLGSFMRLAADVESRGGATVYRFTPESVRRALDAGWTAADFTETVRRSSRTPLPQPLEYLVSDVARRHGQTRIGGAAAYVRSDDESVLDTMLASRELAPLRLRRLAPTVLVS